MKIETMRRIVYAAVITTLALITVACNPAKKYEEEEKSHRADTWHEEVGGKAIFE